MSPEGDQRWSIAAELGAELKAARLRAHHTYADVKLALLGGKEKIWRIETGKGPYKWDHIQALCTFYGIESPRTALFVEMARATEQPDGTWVDSNPARFGLYVLLERRSTQLTSIAGDLMNGLLQTAEYHRAMLDAWPLDTATAEAEQIKLRQERQETFWNRSDSRLDVIMSQAALEHRVGSQTVMDEQLRRIRFLAERKGVNLRYVPSSSPPHGGMRGNFTLVQTELGTSVYTEHIEGGRLLSEPRIIESYVEAARSAMAASRDIREWQ
ncbi:DUF5753 domain-containing protein [Kineosporia sp. NBRC 101731]|uniref:DUF5753 domain-containing protein n=1 Tax=Kineosporia sp. NBRC 101731 TaxID=3032199 RepID=UPI0024A44465|nr:DUF5753 domain-containing protein [Kineosporia sp. NBRC 101731]GLY30818.1 hypothetical protein Kisp02_41830 [Kineosporia sp. NBRC 101731]